MIRSIPFGDLGCKGRESVQVGGREAKINGFASVFASSFNCIASSRLTGLRRGAGGPFQDGSLVVAMQDLSSCVVYIYIYIYIFTFLLFLVFSSFPLLTLSLSSFSLSLQTSEEYFHPFEQPKVFHPVNRIRSSFLGKIPLSDTYNFHSFLFSSCSLPIVYSIFHTFSTV